MVELREAIAGVSDREARIVLLYVRAMKAGRRDLCAYLEGRAQRRLA